MTARTLLVTLAVSGRSLVLLLLLVLGCAPIQRTETHSATVVRSRPIRECHEVPRFQAARKDDGLVVRAVLHTTCRNSTIEEREIKTDYTTHPNTPIFALEVAATAVGTALVVNAAACEDTGEDFSCYGEAIGGLLGLAIGIPAAIATIVDASDFSSGTRTSVEDSEVDVRLEDRESRPMPREKVTLELGNGATVSAITNDAGQAFLPLSAHSGEREAVEGVLRVGAFSQRVRLRVAP